MAEVTEKFKQKIAENLKTEEANPVSEICRLTFFFDDVFRGLIFLREPGPTHAILKTHTLRINPGGDVRWRGFKEGEIANLVESDLGRFIAREEVEARGFGHEKS